MKKLFALCLVLVFVFTSKAQDATQRLQAGNHFYGEGKYEDALREYQAVISSGENFDSNLYLLTARCAEQLNKYELALELYKEALIKETSVDLTSRIYNLYMLMERYADAESLLLRVLREDIWHKEENIVRLLTHYSKLREYEKMIPFLSELRILMPDDIMLSKRLAECYHRNGNDSAAASTYATVLQEEDRDYDSNLFLGMYKTLQGDKEMKLHEDSMTVAKFETRIEHAKMASHKEEIITQYYLPAHKYLQVAYDVKPSTYVKQRIESIHTLMGKPNELYIERRKHRK